MPPLTIPPELKKITQFIRRAEELDRDKAHPESRIVAYYCRQHAVQTGIAYSDSSLARDCLGSILNTLETEKNAMSVFSIPEAYTICKTFAFKVFEKADAEDRSGGAGKSTARTFYASATFLEILGHFRGPEEEEDVTKEEDEKRVYAKWKATEILKAIKEGRDIIPGGFGEEESNNNNTDNGGESLMGSSMDLPPAVTLPPPVDWSGSGTEVDLLGMPQGTYEQPTNPHYNHNNDPFGNTPSAPIPSRAPPPGHVIPTPAQASATVSSMLDWTAGNTNAYGDFRVSNEKVNDAMELATFALTALEERDIELGASRLQQALACLKNN